MALPAAEMALAPVQTQPCYGTILLLFSAKEESISC